jgi:calpain-15
MLLGYDKDLFSIRSRCFILSFHSDSELSVVVRDNVSTNLDTKTSVNDNNKYFCQ